MRQIFLYDLTANTLTNLSGDSFDNFSPQISGDNVVWYGNEYNRYPSEIFLYNGSSTAQLTDNDYWDYNPQISGDKVVWRGNADGGYYGDSEIFLYDGSSGSTTQLTDNDYSDYNPQISGDKVVWQGNPDGGYYGDSEIFLYDGSSTIQLTDNDYWDSSPQISGDKVVWQGYADGGYYGGSEEIFLYDGSGTTQLTDNDYYDYNPQISGDKVVWQGNLDYGDSEIFLYDGSSTIQLTDNNRDDYNPQISGDNVVWEGGDNGGDSDIYLYDGSSGTITNLSEPDGAEDGRNDSQPQITDGKVVWARDINSSPIARDDVLGALPNTTTMTIPVSQLYNSDGYPDFDDFDPEGDAFGIYQVSPGNNAQSVSLERGNVIFNLTPGLTYPNTATFTYTLRDRFNNISDRATVTVNLGKLLQGTNKPDQLSGSAFPDRIEGSGGNDSLVGLAGDDLISGGSGRDILNGGTGRDRLTGGADADSLILDSGEDTVVMNRLDDSLLRAPDVIQGGGGTVNIDVPGNRNVSADFDGFLVPTLTQPLTEKNVKKLLEVLDPDNSFVSVGVSPFKYNNPQSGGTQTFLAIDNGDHIFSGSSDSILEVRGDFYNAHVF